MTSAALERAKLFSKENPAFSIYNRAQSAMERTATLLGLTPTGRKRLSEFEKPKTASDEWDEQND